jgi:hypothetical protein
MADTTFTNDDVVVIKLHDFAAGGSAIINKFQKVR